MDSQRVSFPDGVREALQRLIENAETLGPASKEDALLVAKWRGQFLSAAPVGQKEGALPDGWRLVPVEPTPEMTGAYLKAQHDAVMASDLAWGVSDPKDNFAAGYRAMLAAAPAAPSLAAASPMLVEALQEAIDLIKSWHGPVAWDIYLEHSPEMKRLRAALAAAQEGK